MNPARPHLVFLDSATFGDVSLERFTNRWECTIHEVSSPQEVRGRLRGHSVAVTNKVALDGSVLGSPEAADLKFIAVAATGTDNVDRAAANKLGVRVSNVPGYATRSVAQFTMALVLELATRVGRYGESVRTGEWQESPVFTLFHYPSVELRGKTLGIVGYGNIGRAVAELARGFDLHTLISARPGAPPPIPADRVPLLELLSRADIVTLHCPLTPATKNLINRKTLSLMKPGAFLVNTARGGLIDERALISALREKRLAGAALDVISQEPPSADHALIQAAPELDCLVVTPHCAWTAREARERLINEVWENIAAFCEGRTRNRVD